MYQHFTIIILSETPVKTWVPPASVSSDELGFTQLADADKASIKNELNTYPVADQDITVNVVVKPTDAVIDTVGDVRSACGNNNGSDDEGDEDGVGGEISKSTMINNPVMSRTNRHLDFKTAWGVFPEPAFYDNDDEGESNWMLGQRSLFDRHELEKGGILDCYTCDRMLLGNHCVEWTNT